MDTTTYTRRQILEMDKVPRLKLINSISGFKSANLIGTADSAGNDNLAVFSSVVHVGSNPPLLGCITRPDTVSRHTYQNIRDTGWYTINHIHDGLYQKAHQTSGKYRQDISEFEQAGLTPWHSGSCPAPYVEEARVRIGMRWVEEHKIEANGTVLLIGSVEEIILAGAPLTDDHALDLERAGTVAISGLEGYHKTRLLGRLAYVRVPDALSREEE